MKYVLLTEEEAKKLKVPSRILREQKSRTFRHIINFAHEDRSVQQWQYESWFGQHHRKFSMTFQMCDEDFKDLDDLETSL